MTRAANAAMNQMPFHLQADRGAQARPGADQGPADAQLRPAAGQRAGPGPPGPGSPPPAARAAAARRPRVRSRSMTMQPERGQHPEHDEDVQDRGAGQHQLQAVQRHQQPGDAAQQGRAGHPAHDPGQQQDRQRARPARPRTATRTGSARTATPRPRSSPCPAADAPPAPPASRPGCAVLPCTSSWLAFLTWLISTPCCRIAHASPT